VSVVNRNVLRPRIGVVLSAGGLRGAAHLGVLRRLIRANLPIDVIVGASAGAVVGAYYAAVGLSIDEMISDSPAFRGRHVVFHGLTRRAPAALGRLLEPLCGVIPKRLGQLDEARFDNLHHGVTRFGVVCHDLEANRPCYFSTLDHHGIALADAVKASATIPGVFPPQSQWIHGRHVQLIDGGISDAIPCDFARHPTLGATHLIVSDCRLVGPAIALDERVIHVRPILDGIRSLRSGRITLDEAVRAGETAVGDALIDRARLWLVAGTEGPVPVVKGGCVL
jgi:NTE family protein